jgi:hypothetical protein
MKEKDQKTLARIAGWILFLILFAMIIPEIGGYDLNIIGRLPEMVSNAVVIFALAIGAWRLGVVSDLRGALKR